MFLFATHAYTHTDTHTHTHGTLTPPAEELVQHLVVVFGAVQLLHELGEVEVGDQGIFWVPAHIDHLGGGVGRVAECVFVYYTVCVCVCVYLGLVVLQAAGHEVLVQVGTEEARGGPVVVVLPLLQELQPGHALKRDLVRHLGEVVLEDQGDDALGPHRA